ncbi:TPA: hypothetical protein ACKRW9_003630, partial [Pseudomonas aeruginosa]
RNGDGGREPQSQSDWGRMQGQAFLVTFAAIGKSDSPGGEKNVSENERIKAINPLKRSMIRKLCATFYLLL